MLARTSNNLDHREGSFLWDGVAPSAMELMNIYLALQAILNETFADTASRKYLIKRAAERGIEPKEASYAIVTGKFTPETVEVPIGSRFSHDDYTYVVTEKIENGLYKLQCEQIGREPNGVTGRLISIDYVNGLQTAEIVEVIVLGEDEEDTETFRARYFGLRKSEQYGGNQIDYINRLKEIQGVGFVKIHCASEWNGGGTVLAVILDSELGIPSDELIDEVQTKTDPEQNHGEGRGFAPIGHFVTVIPAYDTKIDISANLTFKSGYNLVSCQTKINEVLDEYFRELNESWESNEDGIIVRLAQIEARLLDVDGIIDIKDTKIKRSTDTNFGTDNIKVHVDSIVSRGTFNA